MNVHPSALRNGDRIRMTFEATVGGPWAGLSSSASVTVIEQFVSKVGAQIELVNRPFNVGYPVELPPEQHDSCPTGIVRLVEDDCYVVVRRSDTDKLAIFSRCQLNHQEKLP